jgi:hypothetical protein
LLEDVEDDVVAAGFVHFAVDFLLGADVVGVRAGGVGGVEGSWAGFGDEHQVEDDLVPLIQGLVLLYINILQMPLLHKTLAHWTFILDRR